MNKRNNDNEESMLELLIDIKSTGGVVRVSGKSIKWIGLLKRLRRDGYEGESR